MLYLEADESITELMMRLPEGTVVNAVNGDRTGDLGGRAPTGSYLRLMGLRRFGTSVVLSFPIDSDPSYSMEYSRIGLPKEFLKEPMPSHIVHGLYNSNYFVVKKAMRF
jgi:hypothetical protein